MKARTRIAVVRALRGLGDTLCAVPALAAIRRGNPGAQITLIGLSAARRVVARCGALVDAFLPFPGFPGIPEKPYSPGALARFLARVHGNPFDLAVQLHGSGTVSNAFTALLGARSAAGLYTPGGYRPEGAFFRYPERGSEVYRWLYLTDSLGCPPESGKLSFPVTADDRAELQAHSELAALAARKFVCMHPGAHDPGRRWPAERFARVADELAMRGYGVVLTGTAVERPTTEAVAAAMRHGALNAAGATSLGATGAVLERAALLVSNDTGISHVAAALRTPSVVVFLASDPDRWAPLDRERHRPIVARGLATAELDGMRCSSAAVPAADEVLEEALALLDEGLADER